MVDNGREIGRIRGYPGDDNFWGLLGVLIKRLEGGTRGENLAPAARPLQTAG